MPMLIYSKDMFNNSDSFLFKNELNCESGCSSAPTDESCPCPNETTRIVIAEKDSASCLVDLTAASCQEENGSVLPPRKRPCFNRTTGSDSSPARRVVCNARGLSKDHNCDTAFFEIPHNAPHGLLLICSHQECIRAGVRFRYCKVCAMPAARRNFFIRHGHGLFETSQELNKHVDNVFGVAHHDLPDNYESTSYCSAQASTTSGSTSSNDNSKDDEKYQSHMMGNTANVSNSGNTTTTAFNHSGLESGRRTLNLKEQAWLQLLHDRPTRSDQVGMANWTTKILRLSLPDNANAALSQQMQHDNCISTLWQENGNGLRSRTMGPIDTCQSACQHHQESDFHTLFDGFGNISTFFD